MGYPIQSQCTVRLRDIAWDWMGCPVESFQCDSPNPIRQLLAILEMSGRILSNSTRGIDRLEGLVSVIEDWHAKVCILGVNACVLRV